MNPVYFIFKHLCLFSKYETINIARMITLVFCRCHSGSTRFHGAPPCSLETVARTQNGRWRVGTSGRRKVTRRPVRSCRGGREGGGEEGGGHLLGSPRLPLWLSWSRIFPPSLFLASLSEKDRWICSSLDTHTLTHTHTHTLTHTHTHTHTYRLMHHQQAHTACRVPARAVTLTNK